MLGRRHRLALALLRRLPQAGLSRLFGTVADLPVPRLLRGPLYGWIARLLGIRTEEAADPLSAYRNVNAFFVRPLRAGARTWSSEPRVAGSPVDAVVGPLGSVRDGTLLQAKGRTYRLEELLASGPEARAMEGGHFLTLYLAPHHYHRIHAPLDGRITEARHLPGRLFPVTPWAREGVADLFPRNERLVASMETGWGRMALVAVGAFNVGRISAAFDPDWNRGRQGAVTNLRRGREREVRRYEPAREVTRGEEMMAFHLGSTVILVWKGEGVSAVEGLRSGREIRLGEGVFRYGP